MKNVVIFDFDGVVLDSWPDQFEWFKHISEVGGKPFIWDTPAKLREVYKEPVIPDMYNFLGFDWEKDKDMIGEEYLEFRDKISPGLVPGIGEVLKALWAETPLGIASNSTEKEIVAHSRRHQIKTYFSAIAGRDRGKAKPSPEILLAAARELNIEPEKAFYVDDTPSGILAAKAAGMISVGAHIADAAYSSLAKIEAENPDYLIKEAKELVDIVKHS
ncbi:HAD family hydrolase [Nanoarchaeota archaeon]